MCQRRHVRQAYLTRPERDERTEGEPVFGSGSPRLGKGGTHGDGEGAGKAGLDLDLGHLPRAKNNVVTQLDSIFTRDLDVKRRSRQNVGDSRGSNVHLLCWTWNGLTEQVQGL